MARELEVKGEVKHTHESATPYSITITRGQKGSYGWEIKVSGAQPWKVIDEIDLLDQGLRKKYLEGQQPEEG